MSDLCKDCQHWERIITRRFECKDPNSEMFGHIMDNWHWSDRSYTEIESRVEKYGECHKLLSRGDFPKIDVPEPYDSDRYRVFPDEDFGCVNFKEKA